MKFCEFKECTFEQNLNRELSLNNMLIFSPSRNLERLLGFDAAIVSRDWRLLRMFWRKGWLYDLFLMFIGVKGIELDNYFWKNISSEIKNAPIKLKFNVFLQHKIPILIDKKSPRILNQWNVINKPYYRYKITKHQQIILEQLEKKFSSNAIILYSAPAFYSFQDMICFTCKRKIFDNSNFVEPSKLKNHSYYAYSSPGNFGYGFSEPEKIESYNIEKKINELKSKEVKEDNIKFIFNTCKSIDEVVKEIGGKLNERYNFLKETSKVAGHRLAKCYNILLAFSYVSHISFGFGWSVNNGK